MAAIIKNIPFVGGSTMTFEFDLGTKVANSTVECPIERYWTTMSTLQPPSNITGNNTTGWVKEATQSQFDKEKTPNDGSYTTNGTTINGAIMQIMYALDLTPLCSALFGSSTSAMQAALQSKTFTCYVRGWGSNNSTQAYSCDSYIWSNANSSWNKLNTNSTSSIAPMAYTEQGGGTDRINSSNKIYFLVCATYPSNGTISSEVDLDYIKITLPFARVPDLINLLSVTLPSTWSMLIKEFSPYWNTSDLGSGYIKYLLGINQSQNSNYDVSYQNGKFVFDNWDGSTAENLWSDSISLTRFQTVNLLIEQTSSGRRMRILQNNGQVLKYSISSSRNFPGTKQMGVLMHTAGQYQADAFLNSMIFLPNKNFDDDTEAEAVLRGTETGFEQDELFDISKVSLNPHATLQGNVISLNATAAWQGSEIYIPILPNNQYTLSFTKTGTGGEAWVDEYYNSIEIKQNLVAALGGGQANGTYTATFVTGPRTNKIHIAFDNGQTTSGAYTFSDISLKLKM